MSRLETLFEGRPWVAHVLVLVLVLVAWSGAVHPGFITRDTRWLVVDNPLLNGGSWQAVPTILWDLGVETRMVLGKEYLPVRDLSVLLDFALFGDRWALHHLQNLGWYALGCLCVFELLRRLLPRPVIALSVALIFALHPVHSENVVWLAGRKDVLSFAFFFAALLSALGGRRGVYGATLLFALAVWSKSTAIMLPACVVGVLWLQEPKRAWRPLFLPLLSLGAVAVVALLLSLSLGSGMNIVRAPRTSGLGELVVLQGRMLLHYLDLMVWTGHHGVVHPEPVILPLAQALNVAGVLALAGLFGGVALAWRQRPLVAFGAGWFLVTMLPMSQIVPLQNLITDRYLLIPSLGLVLAAHAVLPPRWGPVPLLLVPVLVGACLSRTVVWQTDLALWADGRAHAPSRLLTWTTHARYLEEAGQPEAAADLLRQTLEVFPEDPKAYATVAAAHHTAGRVELAEKQLLHALTLDPSEQKALNNLVVLYSRAGEPERALPYGKVLLDAHPDYIEGLLSVGTTFLALDRPLVALDLFKKAVRLDVSDARGHCNVGAAAYLSGDEPLAVRAWGNCLVRDPGNVQATEGLAVLSGGGGEPPR